MAREFYTDVDIKGDLSLDDGGTFFTTVQCVTPTANRTISFPDATGTVALVAGSSGQIVFNNTGAYAGVAGSLVDASGNITLNARFISSLNGAADAPPVALTGTWFSGGTATTTKPQFLIEPTGTTSTAWSTSGTGLGVNAPSGFAGRLLDLQLNGTSRSRIGTNGEIFANAASTFTGRLIDLQTNGTSIFRVSPWNSDYNYGIFFEFHGGSAQQNNNDTYFKFGRTLYGGGLGGGIRTNAGSYFGISSNFESDGTPDVIWRRDSAGALAQRNGGAAQTFRVYGTYTDDSNYVRAALSSASTAVTLAAQTAGTGADDITLNLTAAGTGTVKVNSNLEVSTKNIVTDGTTGTKIGTATTQKLAFWNATPVVQPTAVADITATATTGSLPTPDGSVTIADAATPTVAELLEYCVELEAKLEAALSRLRSLGLIAT